MVRITIKDKNAFVWNANDWLKLRQEHRILGTLYGCIAQIPRQDVENGLPMKLLPEEVSLIREKNFGNLVTYANPLSLPTQETINKHKEHSINTQKEQVEFYEEKRKREIEGLIDKIFEGKKRKLANVDQQLTLDKDTILKTELERAHANNLFSGVNVQIPTAHPWFQEGDIIPAEWDYPKTSFETLKYRVFKDLWEQGYYLTCGTKFGGHFLVYPGEPSKFHAFFIVSCVDKEIPLPKLIMHSRLGTVTKKTFVIASINKEDKLNYSSFEWTGMT